MKKTVLLFLSALCLLLFAPPVSAAPSSDIVKVAVKVNIENPDYFWSYPFGGKQLDQIRFTGAGKSFTIDAGSAGQTFEFEVPQSYTFRLYVNLRSNASSVYEYTFEKRAVSDSNNSITINLRAPSYDPPAVTAEGAEEKKK